MNFRVYKWVNLNWYEGDFKDGKMNGLEVFKLVEGVSIKEKGNKNKDRGGGCRRDKMIYV